MEPVAACTPYIFIHLRMYETIQYHTIQYNTLLTTSRQGLFSDNVTI